MFDNRWDNWAGDFVDSFAASTLPVATRDRVPEILHQFGDFARRVDPNFPDQVAPETFRTIFSEHLPRLSLSPEVRGDVGDVIARFFEFLQEGGRIGEGYVWAEQVRRLEVPASPVRPTKPAGKGVPIRNTPKTAVGRNDPCPCGSGKKYKKCCST